MFSPWGESETTAHSAFRSALATPLEKATEPSVRSKVRVLPDLSRALEDASSILERVPELQASLAERNVYGLITLPNPASPSGTH